MIKNSLLLLTILGFNTSYSQTVVKYNITNICKNISDISKNKDYQQSIFNLIKNEEILLRYKKEYDSYTYIFIPTLRWFKSEIHHDSVFFPLEVLLFNKKKYIGEYFNNRNRNPLTLTILQNDNRWVFMDYSIGSITNKNRVITSEEIANKLISIKAECFFNIDGINSI